MTGMLASVRNLEEAHLVYQAGADIIDLKEPLQGTLGAISLNEIHHVVDELWEKCVISATIGDLPADAAAIEDKVMQTAETGVDYVKVGMFSDRHIEECLPKLVHCANKGIAIIAVFFADMNFNTDHALQSAKQAHFKGAMLDTARKGSGSLLQHKNILQLEYFVTRAKQNDLLTGLAGSLTIEDIPALTKVNADYIGFRTALCASQERTNHLDLKAIEQVRNSIPYPSAYHKKLA